MPKTHDYRIYMHLRLQGKYVLSGPVTYEAGAVFIKHDARLGTQKSGLQYGRMIPYPHHYFSHRLFQYPCVSLHSNSPKTTEDMHMKEIRSNF